MITRRSLVCLAIAGLLLPAWNYAQTTRPTTAPPQIAAAMVEGRVVADDTGLPLPSARVSVALTTAAPSIPIGLTDGDGRFSLSIPVGRFSISTSKSGYARRDVSVPVAGQPLEIRLSPGGVIAGRVIDQSGDPVADVRVALEISNGSRDGRSVASTATDDLGEYRFGGLSEGAF